MLSHVQCLGTNNGGLNPPPTLVGIPTSGHGGKHGGGFIPPQWWDKPTTVFTVRVLYYIGLTLGGRGGGEY